LKDRNKDYLNPTHPQVPRIDESWLRSHGSAIITG